MISLTINYLNFTLGMTYSLRHFTNLCQRRETLTVVLIEDGKISHSSYYFNPYILIYTFGSDTQS
jgi:hypothetical protein